MSEESKDTASTELDSNGDATEASQYCGEEANPKYTDTPTLDTGSKIGRYIILDMLGKGGMGIVYRAFDPALDRRIAIKFLQLRPSADAELARARLLREAQALAKLSHPNVVAAYDVGAAEGAVYVAMEYVEGQTVKDWLAAAPRKREEILKIYMEAGRGLQAAHEAGLIHRDFKPSNVMIGNDGRVRVLDFGLARAQEEQQPLSSAEISPNEGSAAAAEELSSQSPALPLTASQKLLCSDLTRMGDIVGTPPYMAPEQFSLERIGPYTDQFAFCISLYEALYGSRPFAGQNTPALKKNVLEGNVLPPPAGSDVPAWLRAVLLRGLSPKPQDRYPSMSDLLAALSHDPERSRRERRARLWRRLALTAAALVLAVSPLVVWYFQSIVTFEKCRDVSAELRGVWDEESRNAIKKAFLDTGISYAADTARRVDENLAKYVSAWTEIRSQACEARWRRGTESERLFDLKMNCLALRLRELSTLQKVFRQADAEIVPSAVQASLSLTRLDSCADANFLQSAQPPPADAAARAKVEDIRLRLSESGALMKAGRLNEGLQMAKQLKQEAQATGYFPLQAEAVYHLGHFLFRARQEEDAKNTLFQAALLAGKGKSPAYASRSYSLLAFLVGHLQQKPAEGLELAHAAEVMLELAGGDDGQDRATLHNNRGMVLFTMGSYEKAREDFLQAIALDEKVLGPEHPNLGQDLGNLGLILRDMGDYQGALEYIERTKAIFLKSLGEQHPDIAYTYGNLGLVLRDLGQYQKARDNFEQALKMLKELMGEQNPDVGWCLTNLALLNLDLGDYQQAQEYFEQAGEIIRAAAGSENPDFARALLGRGQAYLGRKKPKEAKKLVEEARSIFEKTLGKEHPMIADTLTTLGEIFLAVGNASQARRHFEESLRLREKTVGSENPALVANLIGLGNAALKEGKPARARELFERILGICAKKACSPQAVYEGKFGLARALWKTKHHVRAVTLAQEALAGFQSTPRRNADSISEIEKLLAKKK